MFHTVEDVLRLEGFEGVRLVAGRRGLGRTVTSASLMEVPDILPYVEENTLLITTLYPIAGSREQMEQLIPELGSRGVAGICIKPLRYIEQIPPVMISQADELGFPIVELPMGANLSTLVNLVLSMSLNDYISQLQFRDSVHRNMMEMLLSGAEVEELAEKLAELLQKDIVLLDNQLDSICAALRGEGETGWTIYRREEADRILKGLRLFENHYTMHPIKAGNNRLRLHFRAGLREERRQLKDGYRAGGAAVRLGVFQELRGDAEPAQFQGCVHPGPAAGEDPLGDRAGEQDEGL